jgi:hypothetical protein
MESKIVYLAGLFDGEGCVYLRFRDRHRIRKSEDKIYQWHSKYYELQVTITNKNMGCLEFCQNIFGGRIYNQKNKGNLTYSRWMVEGKKAILFLTAILPYVIIKKPQIEAVLNNPEDKKSASELLRTFNRRNSVKTPTPL